MRTNPYPQVNDGGVGSGLVDSVGATPLPEGQSRFQGDRGASGRMTRDSLDRQVAGGERAQ